MGFIQLKYTKNIDYFIINLLPYLEIYLTNNTCEVIILYATENICYILEIMFGQRIITQKIKYNLDVCNSSLIELDMQLSKFYNLDNIITPSKPLYTDQGQYLMSKKYICIYPKFKPTEPSNNINQTILHQLIEINKLNDYDIYIIGHPFERLNTQYKRIKENDNFIDTLALLQHCQLLITSQSSWQYIALLCNCRNIVVYNNDTITNTPIKYSKKESSESKIDYNPFNNNIQITTDLFSNNTHQFIKSALNIEL